MVKYLTGAVLALTLSGAAVAGEAKVMMQAHETIIGGPISYPDGKPVITSVDVNVLPGEKNGWHSHPVPVFGYQMSGVLTVYYESGEKRVFHAGETIVEAQNVIHMGVNEGTEPVHIIVFYAGAEDIPVTIKAPDYKPLEGQPD